jgi:hypothetical protein
MSEQSPFPEEDALEDEVREELLLLLALAFLNASQKIVTQSFVRSDFQALQDRFRSEAAKALPQLTSISQRAAELAFERTPLPADTFDTDFSDQRYQQLVRNIFNDNMQYLLDTNEQAFIRLQEIAVSRGWSDERFNEYLRKFYGLTPKYIQTVLSLEDALKADGVSQDKINKRVQARIDQLIEWRISLASELIGTEVVEGSKELTWTILGETGQLDTQEFIKSWRSTIDEVTTQTCLDSHLTTAEIGGFFPNGMKSPPNLNVLHHCRSSMVIIRRN